MQSVLGASGSLRLPTGFRRFVANRSGVHGQLPPAGEIVVLLEEEGGKRPVTTCGNANKVIGCGGRGASRVSRLPRMPVRFATPGPFLVGSRPISVGGALLAPQSVDDLVENADPSEYTELAALLNERVISSIVLGMGDRETALRATASVVLFFDEALDKPNRWATGMPSPVP